MTKAKQISAYLIFLISLFPVLLLNAAEPDAISLTTQELPGWELMQNTVYHENELYGYIDGGAEIYREYGFQKLTVQELKNDAQELIVEIYRMKTPEAAFGIFSTSQRNCPPAEGLPKLSCSSPFQLLAAKGPYLLTITNYDGSEQLQQASIGIAEKLLTKIDFDGDVIPSFFRNPFFKSFSRKIKMVSGTLGLQNGFSRWQDYFQDIAQYRIFIAPVDDSHGSASVALIQLPEKESSRTFCRNLGIHPPTTNDHGWKKVTRSEAKLAVQELQPQQYVLVETDGNYAGFDDLLSEIQTAESN